MSYEKRLQNVVYASKVKKFNSIGTTKSTFKSVNKTLVLLKESKLIRNTNENTQYLYYR